MKKIIYLAGGCFWGVEKFFKMLAAVVDTEVGYANGTTENPTYEEVCKHNTGHAETVKITYDCEKISLENLLSLYYKTIDPITINRQGGDIGIQYRTGIYYTDEKDLPIIVQSLSKLQEQFPNDEIAIELEPLLNYYPAEQYHQDYLAKNPQGYCHLSSNQYSYAETFNKKSLL